MSQISVRKNIQKKTTNFYAVKYTSAADQLSSKDNGSSFAAVLAHDETEVCPEVEATSGLTKIIPTISSSESDTNDKFSVNGSTNVFDTESKELDDEDEENMDKQSSETEVSMGYREGVFDTGKCFRKILIPHYMRNIIYIVDHEIVEVSVMKTLEK